MRQRRCAKSVLGLGLVMLMGFGLAPTGALAKSPEKEAAQAADDADTIDGQPIFGRDLMTPEERAQHRAQMRAARTPEEREALRQAHHAAMVQRAKERGVTLPAQPPMRGMGRGQGGPGRGMGMGPGPGAGGPPVAAPPAAPAEKGTQP